MKNRLFAFALSFISFNAFSQGLPPYYKELLRFVQAAPNQGETNTCWFVASTGAMELLLNKKDNIRGNKKNGINDLAESFIIHQRDYVDEDSENQTWLESIVLRFNHGEAVHSTAWPFKAFNEVGTDSMEAWWLHPEFKSLPRLKVPQVKTKHLFTRGKRWATQVVKPADITLMKDALVKHKSPLIVNYNDDGYWHVVLIVGYDDRMKGSCYEIEKEDCNAKGAFYVRDSNGNRFEARAYNWFLLKGNMAAVVELK